MKCILLGYSDEKKGYRLLSSGKFIISRDVIFDETESQNADEIDNLLSHLEKKLTKGKSIHTEKPNSIERDLSPNMDDQEIDNSSSDDDMSRDISNPSPHEEQSRPKWVTQLLKDVHSDEQNKLGTRSSSTSQSNYALISNDSTNPLLLQKQYNTRNGNKLWLMNMIQ